MSLGLGAYLKLRRLSEKLRMKLQFPWWGCPASRAIDSLLSKTAEPASRASVGHPSIDLKSLNPYHSENGAAFDPNMTFVTTVHC